MPHHTPASDMRPSSPTQSDCGHRRSGRAIAPLLLSSLIGVAGTAAADPGQFQFKTAYKLAGSCDLLTTPGHNYTDACGDRLFQLIYPDQRQSLVFTAAGIAIISFNGTTRPSGAARSAKALTVDHISVVSSGGSKTEAQAATGSCSITTTEPGVFLVKCSGRTAAGGFAASFLSDGSIAERQDF